MIAERLILGRYMTRHCVAVNNRKWERQEDDRFFRGSQYLLFCVDFAFMLSNTGYGDLWPSAVSMISSLGLK